MNQLAKTNWICLLVGLACSFNAGASVADQGHSPYQGIMARNVFALHAALPSLVETPPPPAISKIMLTGITTILGSKLVFLTITSITPGAAPESVMLAEGHAWNEIEVRSIDEKAGLVKVVNHGRSQTLDFEHDNIKPFAPPKIAFF